MTWREFFKGTWDLFLHDLVIIIFVTLAAVGVLTVIGYGDIHVFWVFLGAAIARMVAVARRN